MVSASTSGEAAAQALRALRRAAQLHTERRAATSKPGKPVAQNARRGRGMGSDATQLSQPATQQSQMGFSQADTVPGDQCCSQRDDRDALASLSTQTPSNMQSSSLDTSRASQVFSQPVRATQPANPAPQWMHPSSQHHLDQQSFGMHQQHSHAPSLSQPLWPSSQHDGPSCAWPSSQPQLTDQIRMPVQQNLLHPSTYHPQAQSSVAEAAAALAAALAPLAGAGGHGVVRRRYRCKAPPPPCSPHSTVRPRSPSVSSTPCRKRRRVRRQKSQAEVVKEVSTETIRTCVGRLSEDLRRKDKERAAGRTKCQKAASMVLRLLNEHQRACRESGEALAGTIKAADAALSAVVALERLHCTEQGRLSAPPMPARSRATSLPMGLPTGSVNMSKRKRRIDGITA
ncbi:unnamed protein product [Effrenium voratum]|uniref:Uncharacterized protein n=2 Tax=Effrenium voratum TaxID=2562239 RepID=A0AA36JPE1_9DINO|nr:unnamed protein product [Effrenium voratum]